MCYIHGNVFDMYNNWHLVIARSVENIARNAKNSIAINSISGYTPTLLEIAKNRNAKNIISGYIPILISP